MRNRPVELADDPAEFVVTPEILAALEQYRQSVEAGMSPDKVADYVFQAIRDGKFYILTHPEFTPYVKTRVEAVLQGRNPTDLAELATLMEARLDASIGKL